MVKESKAYQYAEWCMQPWNLKAPVYVKKQAKAWLDIADGNNQDAYIDTEAYERICRILKLMVHPDLNCSMDEGMEEYAWFLITAVFCTKQSKTGYRYYTTALLEISRKNFKTFYSAVIFIIGMLTEQQFSRFFSVAPDLKLSSELKLAIRKIIKSSPALVDSSVFKILRSEVRCLITESEYVPLAYSEDKMDGKLAHIFLADEAGAMDNYPIEAMRSSQITLHEKLGIIISTQYPNDNNAMIDEIDKAKKTLDGLRKNNKRTFALLYEPDDNLLKDDQWQTNDLVIYQSNPVAVAHEYIFDAIVEKREDAVLYENKRENYLCKHNNIKYKSLGVEGYVAIDKVQECKIVEDLEFWIGKRVFVGMDLSQTEDNTSIAMCCEHEGNIYAKVWGFIPQNAKIAKSKREGVDYGQLIRDGVCFECGDDAIDYGFVERHVLGLEEKYGVEIVQIGYDRHNALSSVQKFEDAGYECVMVKQHSSVLHSPTKLLKEEILHKTFRYEENLMLEINFQNARCTADTNLNKYVNKKKSVGKVDMVVAVINGMYLLEQEMLYADRNFVVQT